MSLAALICAYHESDEPGGPLRATLPLAGRTLVERQARLARSAGADRVILLVERLPRELLVAIDRLATEGIGVTVARSASDAADAVQASDRLLLIADGLVADERHISRIASADGAAILTIPDHASDERFERIDARSRWAGLAMIDGETLQRTVAMLHDWDPQSTLLRRAVQGNARQFLLPADGAEDRLVIAETSADLEEVEMRIVERAGALGRAWISHFLLGPIEAVATRLLMPTALTPEWLHVGGALLTAIATFFFTRGWLAAGLVLLLLSTPLSGIADRLAALRLQHSVLRGWWRHVMPVLSAAALLALSWWLMERRGWGCVVLAVSTIAFLIALRIECASGKVAGVSWLAERKSLIWLMLPFAITSQWTAGLAALAVYSIGSFFWAQRQVHRLP